MTFIDWAPWVTSAGALVQLATVRRHPKFAFTLGLAYQPLWIAYSFATGAYGFLVATAAFVGVNAWNLWKVLRAERDARRLLAMLDRPPRDLPNLRALFEQELVRDAFGPKPGPKPEVRIGERELMLRMTEDDLRRATGGRVVYQERELPEADCE